MIEQYQELNYAISEKQRNTKRQSLKRKKEYYAEKRLKNPKEYVRIKNVKAQSYLRDHEDSSEI